MSRWTRIFDPDRDRWIEVLLEEPAHLYRGVNFALSGPPPAVQIVDRAGRPIRSAPAPAPSMGFHR